MSQQSDWRRFVRKRSRELRDLYPCAGPTQRRLCPRHRCRLGPVTGMCLACHHGLYAQLGAEYSEEHRADDQTDRRTEMNKHDEHYYDHPDQLGLWEDEPEDDQAAAPVVALLPPSRPEQARHVEHERRAG